MEILEQVIGTEVAREIGSCHPLLDDDWAQMSARIPVEIEALARETKALQRKREIKSAQDLLRLVLAYSVCDLSLRMVGAWATIIDLGHLSDVAVRKRLLNTLPWLGQLVGTWLQKRQQGLAGRAVRVRLIDATVISEPASQGIDWRLHARFDLAAFCMTGVEITDVRGGETLERHTISEGEINVADRGYAHRKGLGAVFAALAYIVVRVTWQNLPLETVDGHKWDLIRWLRTQSRYPCETPVWVVTPAGRFEVRLVAQRLPKDRAEEARRRARKASHKKGHTPKKDTLFAAGYILLVTNLPALAWATEQVLALYRLRWQVELLFKRLKSILNLDQLRTKDPVPAQVYLLGKLVGALLMEEWTSALTASGVGDWFDDTVRPVSPWRWTSLWTHLLRHAICGPVTLSRFLAALPRLARYLCDAPRKRRQQAACARHWLNALTLPAHIPHLVDCRELALA